MTSKNDILARENREHFYKLITSDKPCTTKDMPEYRLLRQQRDALIDAVEFFIDGPKTPMTSIEIHAKRKSIQDLLDEIKENNNDLN